jgi:hypothetical protein
MSDKSNPSTAPKVGGNNESAANTANEQRKYYPKEKPRPRQGKTKKWLGLTESKRRELLAIVMLIPWVWVEIVDCHNFVKLCLLALSLGVAQFVSFSFFKNQWRGWTLALWLISLIPIATVVWINSRPEPKIDFDVELQIEGSSPVVLTNEFFFKAGMVNELHKTNGFLLFNGVAAGCIVVPVFPGESNKVFNLTVENKSPFRVFDLVGIVGFPKENEIGIDQERWHKMGGMHWLIPGWKMQVTNLQYWAFQSPWALSFSDSIGFPPITNFSIPVSNSMTNKQGYFELFLRSSGFERLMSANVVFWHVPTNVSFKPFVARMEGTNGIWRVAITTNEFEQSQK